MLDSSNIIFSIPYYIILHFVSYTWQTSAVKVSDVFYNNFEGTSSSEKAIILNCSQSIGCDNLRLTDIFIKVLFMGQAANPHASMLKQ
ncbi:hypothetical protein Pint_30101 [Pistacia integerrima]|uniref:Uncharacterized protein n=1 Tax=Pistacia integerrima TaxID=434235 RepID=A0ACC0X123_9ROSI|nr:hypothetical protein Pint_30101 [Pistacia integerrima]